MKLGAYTACLHDRPLDETLKILGELGLTGAEINTGGFIAAPHIPIDDILAGAGAREDYLGRFQQAGITLTGLNVNGNPLNPDPGVGPKHAEDLRRTIEVAAALGVKRVVTMSGLPAGEPGGTVANWVVNPWDSQYLDILDYQWTEVAVPFWRDIQARAAAHDVKVCIEMHPHNLVFNPPTLQRLVEQTNATHIGAEMDPSHLFWQGMDPVEAVRHLGGLVFHAAAKDTRINDANVKRFGVLDDRFDRTPADANPLNLGGRNTVNQWSVLAVRGGRPRPRRGRLLGAVPAGAARRRPGHGGQHRARGRRTGPGRGPAAGGRQPGYRRPAGRGGDGIASRLWTRRCSTGTWTGTGGRCRTTSTSSTGGSCRPTTRSSCTTARSSGDSRPGTSGGRWRWAPAPTWTR
jgi:sugar phosphate isomerase/epimerase